MDPVSPGARSVIEIVVDVGAWLKVAGNVFGPGLNGRNETLALKHDNSGVGNGVS